MGTYKDVDVTNVVLDDVRNLQDNMEQLNIDIPDLQSRMTAVEADVGESTETLHTYASPFTTGTGYDSTETEQDLSTAIVESPVAPRLQGRSVTNIVQGEDIANAGTVSFDSITGYEYYDSLHNIIINGDDTQKTVTNDSGTTANIMVMPVPHWAQSLTASEKLITMKSIADKGWFYGLKGTDGTRVSSLSQNLFDGVVQSGSSVTSVKLSEKSFSITPISSSALDVVIIPNVKFKPNTVYTFSGLHKQTGTYNSRLRIRYTDGTVTNFDQPPQTGLYESFSISSTVGKSIQEINPTYTTGGQTTTYDDFQITEGTTAPTEYIPYQSSTSDFPTVGHGLNAHDEILNDNGWKRIKRHEISAIPTATAISVANLPLAKSGGRFMLLQDNGRYEEGLIDGSVATDDAGDIIYELAVPTTTTPIISNSIQVHPNGTVYIDGLSVERFTASGTTHVLTGDFVSVDELYIIGANDELEETTISYNESTKTLSGLTDTTTYLAKGTPSYHIGTITYLDYPFSKESRNSFTASEVTRMTKQMQIMQDTIALLIAKG